MDEDMIADDGHPRHHPETSDRRGGRGRARDAIGWLTVVYRPMPANVDMKAW